MATNKGWMAITYSYAGANRIRFKGFAGGSIESARQNECCLQASLAGPGISGNATPKVVMHRSAGRVYHPETFGDIQAT